LINKGSMKKSNRSRQTKKILFGLLTTSLLIAVVWGIRWAAYARPPLPEAVQALESDNLIQVKIDPWLTFIPAKSVPATALIFYPGGRIAPQGYSSLMRTIAMDGYLVIVPKMPLNMAPFNINIAKEIQAYFPEIDHWVIGGHSVGGTMAAQYTDNHLEEIDGLIFWASYPANNVNLANHDLPVILIYGSSDPRVNAESVKKRTDLLPQNSQIIRIEGGDHHQFGSYQINPKDHLATTSRVSQHQQIIQATLDLLATVSNSE